MQQTNSGHTHTHVHCHHRLHLHERLAVHCPSLCHFLPLSTPHTTSTSLTCTDHSCISPEVTAMHSKTTMATLSEAGFTAITVHIVIPNWTASQSKSSKPWCPQSCAIAQFTTDHCGITQVPAITTHSPPATTVEDLHTSLRLTGPTNQSKRNWKGESGQERVGSTGRCWKTHSGSQNETHGDRLSLSL